MRMTTPEFPLLHGTEVPIAFQTELISQSHTSGSRRGNKLVIYSSDVCGACESDQPKWQRILKNIPDGTNLEVLLISWRSHRLQEDLLDIMNRRHISWKQLRPRDLLAFTTFSGFTVTPTVALLDSDDRVLLVTHRFNDQVERLFLDELAGR